MQAQQVLNRITADPTFKVFAQNDFDHGQFASLIVNADTQEAGSESRSRAENTLSELSVYIDHIDGAIQSHVNEHRDKMLESVGGVRQLQRDCETLEAGVQDVKRSVDRVRREILEPFKAVKVRTRQLERVNTSIELLKRVLRVSMTVKKLRALEPSLCLDVLTSIQRGDPDVEQQLSRVELRELSKAAQSLNEIEGVVGGEGVKGVSVVESELPFIQTTGDSVRTLAAMKLKDGMRTLQQADIAGALQVFYHLGELPDRVHSACDGIVGIVRDKLTIAFGRESLERLGTGDVSDPSVQRQIRRRVSEHAEDVASFVHERVLEVWNLQRVLAKKTDPVTHERFLDVIRRTSSMLPYAKFWQELLDGIRSALRQPISNSDGSRFSLKHVKSRAARRAIVELYPSLRRAMLQNLSRLRDWTHDGPDSAAPTQGENRVFPHQISHFNFYHLYMGEEEAHPAPFYAQLSALEGHLGSRAQTAGEPAAGELDEWLARSQLPSEKDMLLTSQLHASAASDPELAGVPTPSQSTSVMRGGSEVDAANVLSSLKPLEMVFLEHSQETLAKPVDQMFPNVEGYANAVPSKHDIHSFMRIVQAEIDRSVQTGEWTLAPVVLGVVAKIIQRMCKRIAKMVYTSPPALDYSTAIHKKTAPSSTSTGQTPSKQGGSVAGLSVEQDHNYQLLALLSHFHQSLRGLPATMQKSLSKDGQIKCDLESTAMQVLSPALKSLEGVARSSLLKPMVGGMAHSLEQILARVHDDSFSHSTPSGREDECSTYLTEFSEALEILSSSHLSRLPEHFPVTQKARTELATRITRSFVSHLALVRPLSSMGAMGLAKDMALYEMAVSTHIADTPTLGRAHSELKAFKQLLFLESEDIAAAYSDGDSREALRPSTLLHHSFARAPPTLSSPPRHLGVTPEQYVEWLVTGHGLNVKLPPLPPLGLLEEIPGDSGAAREAIAWEVVQAALDAYAQRCSGAETTPEPIYNQLSAAGSSLLERYLQLFLESRKRAATEGATKP